MKLGFIGTGNMAGAIMGGIIKKGIIAPEEIIGSDIMEAGRERAKKEHGIHVTADNIEVTQKAEVLVLSVKPQFYAQTIAEIIIKIYAGELPLTATTASIKCSGTISTLPKELRSSSA